ncbi:YhgE/Pip family protein [Microbacterium sp. T2.11-28]|uniref:YhgE/Pip family protein n=1 Tax=Microbacterium sp. T2.11-28 TaxID=3041169 RepID=UPI002477765A|nr:YhgE/Pip family protein [Microbacterium sp. T2.11-28]CAI9390849.1 hypothetical protein MICABA_01576 [Microbacterium sp. T2.11-28]
MNLRSRPVRRFAAICAVALVLPIVAGGLLAASIAGRSGSLDAIPVAIVNDDEIVTGETPMAAGRALSAALVHPDDDATQLDWTLASADTAAQGLADGDYQAVLTIPEEFSADVLSIATDDPRAAQITLQTTATASPVGALAAEAVTAAAAAELGEQITVAYLTEVFDGFDSIASGMASAADGAASLSDGATQISSGADSLGSGAAELADGLDTAAGSAASLADGAERVADGAASLADGADDLSGGAGEVAAGARALGEGAQTLSAGLDDTASGAARVTEATASVASGAGEVAAGLMDLSASCAAAGAAPTFCAALAQTRDGAGAVHDGATQAADGAATVSNALTQLSGAGSSLADGTASVADGAASVESGAASLARGAVSVADNTVQLADGAAALADGIASAADGAAQLGDGAAQLADGATSLDEGAATLADELDDAAAQVPQSDADDNAAVIATPIVVDSAADIDWSGWSWALVAALALWLTAPAALLLGRRALSAAAGASTATTARLVRALLAPRTAVAILQAGVVLTVLLLAGADLGSGLGSGAAFVALAVLASLTFTLVMSGIGAAFGRAAVPVILALSALQIAAVGGIVPLETAPAALQPWSALLPATRYLDAAAALAVGDATGAAGATIVLSAWAAVGLALTATGVRRRRTALGAVVLA